MNACRSVCGPTRLVIPASTCHAPHDPPGGVAVQPIAVSSEEDGSFAALTDGEVNRASRAGRERNGDDLAALAQDRQGAMPALEAE